MKPTKAQIEMARRRITLAIVTHRSKTYWDRAGGINVDVLEDLDQSRKQVREVMIGLRALRNQK